MTDIRDELFDERMKTIDTRLRLNKLIALNLQLFNAILAYARTNNIALTFNPRILNLVKQIEAEDANINRRKVTPCRTDEDETEPCIHPLLGY
jgi:hypothetical protein